MKLFILLFCVFVGNSEAFGKLPNLLKTCIDDLGCFNYGPPFFHPLSRPISLPPDKNSKAKFMLYTQTNPSKAYLLETTTRSLQKSPFDPSVKTIYIIHGFKFPVPDTHFQAKDELLKRGAYNVFIVDWTECNSGMYPQAVSNTRVIGALIAKMINFLMAQTGISAQSVHLVGHSLGAHIAGYAGEIIPNIGRITGLDPAGPWFQGTDKTVRLDPTDAIFVDAIHTNAAPSIMQGLGMTDAVGHMDFYPNGGSSQPGCANATGEEAQTSNDPTAIFGNFKCHHLRANRYFLESINPSNRFQSVLCGSFAEFEKRKCSSSTKSPMGFHAKKLPGLTQPPKFFCKTSADPPFSLR